MSIQATGAEISWPVAADYSAKQFYLMDVNTSGQAVLVSAAGQKAIGVLQDDPAAAGRAGLVRVSGTTKVIAGGTVAKGDVLTSDANGKAVARTAEDQCVIGIAVGSAASNEIFQMFLIPWGQPQTYHGKVITFQVNLASITGAGDVLTNWTPGFAGTIEKFSAAVMIPVTTGSKAATLNLEIGTTNVTGGSLALTSANCTPLGAVIDATAITAANTFTATDTISIEAASVTAFVEGTVNLLIVYK